MKVSKHKIIILVSLIFMVTSSLMAVVEFAFTSWSGLVRVSPDIVIARCSRTPDPDRDRGAGPTGALVYSAVEVVSILKGAGITNLAGDTPRAGASRLVSEFYPRQGEYYLVFSIFHDGEYEANERYRVIPLGLNFSTNDIPKGALEERIKSLLQYRLNYLNREIPKEQQEKERTEEGIKEFS